MEEKETKQVYVKGKLEESQLVQSDLKNTKGVCVEGKGKLDVYRYPKNSLTNEITNFSIAKDNFCVGAVCTCMGLMPIASYYFLMIKKTFSPTVVGVVGVVIAIYGIAEMYKSRKTQKMQGGINENLAEKLSEVEPNIIPNEEAKKRLAKRL